MIEAMAAAGADKDLANSTLHLVDPEPVPAAELFDLLAQEYAGRKTAYRLPPRLVAGSLHVPAVRKLFSGAPAAVDPLPQPPGAASTRAPPASCSSRRASRCPRFEEYVGPLVKFFREHEDDPSYMPGG